MEFCNDCGKITEGETVIVYLTDDPNAYEDGEYELICPFCGGNAISNINEDQFDR